MSTSTLYISTLAAASYAVSANNQIDLYINGEAGLLTDVTSGFRAANERAVTQYLDHYPAEYLGDTIDSLVVAIRSGCKVTQVPVEMRPRQGGKPSHNPLKAAIYLGRSVFALLFALTRKPTQVTKPAVESVVA